MDDLIIGEQNNRPGARPAVEAALAADGGRALDGSDGAHAAAIRGVLVDERRSSSPVIEVDALNVTYGDFHAVKDLSFHVERSELYALLGTNGAGKTSALEVIEGHRRASSGTVRVFDRSPTDRRRVRPRMGMMLATAGVTRSPEHAQVTTLPLSLGTIAIATWVGLTGTEQRAPLKLLLPGGSATELVVDSWNGGVPRTESLLLLAPTLAWVVVAIALATRLFRWEPRR